MSDNMKPRFGAVDILIFSGSLFFSLLVGIYYAYVDRKRKSVDNYYFGSRKMSPIPLSISISVTFISAITVIGLPTETYLFGVVTAWHGMTLVGPNIIACLYYIPLIHNLNLSTVYQILYMGTTVYLPALGLSAVTSLDTKVAIALTSGICTMYTVCGGLKAVVWTDTMQAGIMLIGTLAALIQATLVVGGPSAVWAAVERGGRDNMFDFDLDPTLRVTVWTYIVGNSITQAQTACCNQSIAQRYLSCQSIKDARIASMLALITRIVLSFLTVGCGAAAYAYFEHCDPLTDRKITKDDQIFPYMVLEIFQSVPGMTGLFVAAAYSGTLSSVSSGINSVSSMILQDFVLPCVPNLSGTKQLAISKLSGVVVGVLLAVTAYIWSETGSTALSLVITFRGACGGPILGVFTLGLFLPWCNSKGALVGQIVGTAITFWISVGGLIYGKDPATIRRLPTSTDGCVATISLNQTASPSFDVFGNSTFLENNASSAVTTLSGNVEEKHYSSLYALSHMYYSPIGVLVTIFVGLLVSCLTGPIKPEDTDPNIFVPILDNEYFPEKVRKFFRFGVPEVDPTVTIVELNTAKPSQQDANIFVTSKRL